DGTRVLLMPLCFLSLFTAALLPRTTFLDKFTYPAGAVLVVLTLTLQPDHSALMMEYVNARKNAHAVVDTVASWAEAAGDEAVMIIPEPSPSGGRRILDPGAALIMAVNTRWLADHENATWTSVADNDSGRFG